MVKYPKRLGNPTMPTTIRDVAEKLNISIYTVSRALDGYDDVADGTRKLVIKTADEMGYAPNRAARQLRRQKAETIGFIIPSISKRMSESFFTEFVVGLGDELSARHFDLLIANATTEEAEQDLYHRWVNSRKVDGFILSRICRKDWRVDNLSRWGIPFVGLGKSHNAIKYPCIRIEGAKAYVDLVRHIQANGFSRFAFVGGPAALINQIDRLKWFKSALKKSGLDVDPHKIVSTDMSSTGGYEAARRLLISSTPPDAIACVNDETAFGVLHAAHEQGLIVGKDVAVVGFEGVQESRHTEPPLTTLDIPVAEIAQQLMRLLIEHMDHQTIEVREIVVKPELRIRASTGSKEQI
jgi:LacI family transcriptional regulator